MPRDRLRSLARGTTRRDAVKVLGGAVGALAAGRAIDNVLLGYGDVVGTNLRRQAQTGDLAALTMEGFLRGSRDITVPGGRLRRRAETLVVEQPTGTTVATLPLADATVSDARAVDRDHGLDGATEQVLADLQALQAGEFSLSFARSDAFFERAGRDGARPYTVGLARDVAGADADAVAAFADADPADPQSLVGGLVQGFREETYYDVPRYAAGSVQDNVLFGTVELRGYFQEPVTFAALATGGETGVFCYEYVARSIEALHAVPTAAQSPPVVAGHVHDGRHKHAYTVVATIRREAGELVLPVTFLDYTHSTLYDDLSLTGVLGEGLEAYNDRHRAEAISWS